MGGDFLRKVLWLVLWLFFLLLGFAFPDGVFGLLIGCFSFIMIGSLVNPKSSLHMMFFLGYGTFLFIPSVANWYYLDIDFLMLFLSSLASAFFLHATRKTETNEFIDFGSPLRVAFIVFCIFCSFLVLAGIPVTPVMAFLIILMSMSFRQGMVLANTKLFLIYIFVFALFTLYSWDGFGRTVVMGWLILAGLQFAYSIGFKINVYALGLIPGLAATLLGSRDLLKLNFSGFENSLYDSAYGPYRFASSLIYDYKSRGPDLSGFFDQIIFTFFIFIPRSIWPDKPYGFGFEYVVRHMETNLIDAGHSVASTLIGDHIYYLGYFGVFTSLIILSMIAAISNLLYRTNGLNGNGVLIFSASMMALVWGGMTSFSARVILPTIFFVILLVILRRIITNKVKLVRSS